MSHLLSILILAGALIAQDTDKLRGAIDQYMDRRGLTSMEASATIPTFSCRSSAARARSSVPLTKTASATGARR